MLCFASPLAVLLFAPFIGQKLDASRRSGLFVWALLLVQITSIVLSGVLLSMAFWTGTSIIGGWAFVVLLALQMVEKLSAVTSEVAIERDWITRICGKGNTAGLAHGNSMIRRFDLVCDFVGTVGVGVIIDRLGVGAAVWYCMLMSVVSWPVINTRLRLLNIDGGEAPKTDDKLPKATTAATSKERNTIRVYFFDNPMLFSSLVVVLLYFNVALSPGGILSAYLIHCDVTGTGLAMFRGACAIMGFLGSLAGKALINARGLMSAGRIRYVAMVRVESIYGLILHLPLLNSRRHLRCSRHYVAPQSRTSLTFVVATLGISLLVRIESVVLFAALISASRMGVRIELVLCLARMMMSSPSDPSLASPLPRQIWAFDNVNAQLFQQGTRSSEQSGLAATEAALCSAAEIMMVGLVVGRGKAVAVEWFGWLGFLGWIMVVGCWIGFFGFSRKGLDTLQSTNK